MFSNNHGSYGTAGLEITINKSGKYSFTFTSSSNGASNTNNGLSLSSSQLTTVIQSINDVDTMGFEFEPLEEVSNDTSYRFDVSKKPIVSGAEKAKLKGGAYEMYCAGEVLDCLCEDGFIEEGEYLINVCW